MDLKDIATKLGELESGEIETVLKFTAVVMDLEEEEQEIVEDMIELIKKKVDYKLNKETSQN